MAPIAVSLDRDGPAAGVVSLSGENDAYAAERIENELTLLLEAGMHVVVDLGEATFVDSQTLSVLLSGRNRAAQAGLGYALVLPVTYTQVHRILEMTGLDSSFSICSTVADALTSVRAAGSHAHAA